jgi:hypothetical protein
LYPATFLFPQPKKKLKNRNVDTDEIEAESQADLNTLKEHDFQDAFNKMAETLRMVHKRGRGPTLRIMVVS